MQHIGLQLRANLTAALVSLVALFVTLHPGVLSAKTPDGVPPSQETVCSGLTGAAFGLCNAYCEAQDCDVHPRASCAQLRRNFARITGSTVFPCDSVCGDGTVGPGEDCDPPGSACGDGGTCAADCTCPAAPVCGDGTVQAGEECDPPGSECTTTSGVSGLCSTDCTCEPASVCGNGTVEPGEECDGSPCATGAPCNADCTCAEQTACCECPSATAPTCSEVRPTDCLNHGCTVGPAGSTCDPAVGRCVPPPPSICCQCAATAPAMCFDTTTQDDCTLRNCTPVLNSSCGANGLCQ